VNSQTSIIVFEVNTVTADRNYSSQFKFVKLLTGYILLKIVSYAHQGFILLDIPWKHCYPRNIIKI